MGQVTSVRKITMTRLWYFTNDTVFIIGLSMFPFTEIKSLRFLCVKMEFASHLIQCLASLRDYLKYRQTLPPLTFTLELEFCSPPPHLFAVTDPLFVLLDWTVLGTLLLQLAQSQTVTNLRLHIRVLPGFSPKVASMKDSVRSKLPELDRRGLLSFQIIEDA